MVEQSGHIVQYSLEDNQLKITNTCKDNDTYINTVFSGLTIKYVIRL